MTVEKREKSLIQSINELKLKCEPALLKNEKFGFDKWKTAKSYLLKKKGNSEVDGWNIAMLRYRITMIDNASGYLIDRIKHYKNYVDQNRIENFDKTDKRLKQLNIEFNHCQGQAQILLNKITAAESKKKEVKITKDERALLNTIASSKLTNVSNEKLNQAPTNTNVPNVIQNSINTVVSLVTKLTQKEVEALQVQAFKKIYNALYDGQSSFFKSPKAALCQKKDLTVNDIRSYVKSNDGSRSAYAWLLATDQANYENPTSSNQALFAQIHSYSYKHSSSFIFSLFRQSKNFPEGYKGNIQKLIENAEDDSRTGLIRNALN